MIKKENDTDMILTDDNGLYKMKNIRSNKIIIPRDVEFKDWKSIEPIKWKEVDGHYEEVDDPDTLDYDSITLENSDVDTLLLENGYSKDEIAELNNGK
jgi:hypothetical protein